MELKYLLSDVVVHLKLSFLKNSSQFYLFRSWLTWIIYFSWKNIWEWKMLELVLLSCHLLFPVTSKGFNNMQFRNSTPKKH